MDDTARKASGGVRNLRAMFENRDNSEEPTPSPQPNRGRSGAPDSARATHSPALKPLNKVQTNFIAVDKTSKSGTIQRGLQSNNINNTTSSTDTTTTTNKKNDTTSEKNIIEKTEDKINKKESTYIQDTFISPPLEPEMPRRRDSFSLHDDLPIDHKTIQERKASIAEEFRNRAQSIQIGALDEPIPEFAVETPALETPAVDGNRARHQLGYSEPPVSRTTANPDKPTNDDQPGVHMNRGDPKSEDAVTEGKALQGGSLRGLTGGDAKSMREAAVQGLKATPAKATLAMRGAPSPSSASNSPAQVTASSNSKKPLRSPPLQKTPVSAAAAQRTAASGSRNVSNVATNSAASTAKPATKATTSTASSAPKPTTSSTARSSATAATTSQAAKKIPSGGSATSSTGFHKPRPKSPTRPARLPASLMAPTASSISKVAGAENTTTTQSRRVSAGTLAQNKVTGASKTRNETLKHTTSHSKPSVGPPPSSATHKKPASGVHTTKPAEDSFLARMMRPTAASSSKVVGHEANPSPPKPKASTAASSAYSRPVTREKVHAERNDDTPKKTEDKKAEQPMQAERPKLEEKISEPISPKTEAPPKHHEPHVDPPKPSLPSHAVPKVVKTERTVSITDMENSDGTIKKLPPGAIPIPKIAKKKKPQPVAVEEHKKVPEPPRSPRLDVSDVPKEKKRDFLLEVREEEKRHRRMSERPSMVKNPTSIPEVAEPEDEEVDDHQLPSGSSGDDADISGGSMEIPRTTPKKSLSPKKPLSPETSSASKRGSLEENAIESQMMSAEDVDDVDIAAENPSQNDIDANKTRRLSMTAEKAMDYAAEAVDQAAAAVDEAVAHKESAGERAKMADEKEADAVQGLSQGHPLTSAMLNGSALDTDDEYTPSPAERGNPFEEKQRKESTANDFSVEPTMKEGEGAIVEDRKDVGGESKLPIDKDVEMAEEEKGEVKLKDGDVTALAS